MSNGNKDGKGGALVIGGAIGAVVATLLTKKPVAAAPVDEKWDYLIECQETIIRLLEQLVIAPPGIEVTVKTPWVAKDPEQIYSHALRVVGTFDADTMVNWTKGKRFLLKVESSLNQPCTIQVVGNFVDNMPLATNIDGPLPCAANSNISVGLAFDDWHPFIGVRITTPLAPTAGILNIWAVIQE